MPKFAVYFIPQADDPFYQLGTQILGYDVREKRRVTVPATLLAGLGEIDPSWVSEALPFGFHLTICDALDCDWATIPLVELRSADLLSCFNTTSPFTFHPRPENPVAFRSSANS